MSGDQVKCPEGKEATLFVVVPCSFERGWSLNNTAGSPYEKQTRKVDPP